MWHMHVESCARGVLPSLCLTGGSRLGMYPIGTQYTIHCRQYAWHAGRCVPHRRRRQQLERVDQRQRSCVHSCHVALIHLLLLHLCGSSAGPPPHLREANTRTCATLNRRQACLQRPRVLVHLRLLPLRSGSASPPTLLREPCTPRTCAIQHRTGDSPSSAMCCTRLVLCHHDMATDGLMNLSTKQSATQQDTTEDVHRIEHSLSDSCRTSAWAAVQPHPV